MRHVRYEVFYVCDECGGESMHIEGGRYGETAREAARVARDFGWTIHRHGERSTLCNRHAVAPVRRT